MELRRGGSIMMSRRACVCALCLVTVLSVVQPAAATANEVTVLVNGSFNAYPPWMDDWSPEFSAIAGTYGVPPIQFRWFDNDAVYAPFYSGISNGAFAFANFINALGVPPWDHLNVVAHSHGGNVVLWGSWFLSRPMTHVINLGTPVNWDLPGLGGYGAYSHCQVSSYSDWVQFVGASPYQVAQYGVNEYYAGENAFYAAEALAAGDWDSFSYYTGLSAWYEAQAQYWWLSTKIEYGASNQWFWGESHGDLH